MDKQNVAYYIQWNIIQLYKQWNSDPCYIMHESWRYAKWNISQKDK